jgi:membrane associated rhomboid family serine protease
MTGSRRSYLSLARRAVQWALVGLIVGFLASIVIVVLFVDMDMVGGFYVIGSLIGLVFGLCYGLIAGRKAGSQALKAKVPTDE